MKENPNNPLLKFDQNWNCKLYCNVFTTLRPRNDEAHFIGAKFDAYLKETFMGDVEVMQVVNLANLDKMTDAMALIDTGYGKAETIEILETLYIGLVENIRETEFSYIVLRRISQDINHNNQKNEVTSFSTLNISA